MPVTRRLLTIAALMLLVPLSAPRAAEVRVLASDERGVTLRLDVGDYTLVPDGDDGRLLPVVDGLDRTGLTGRPRLPFGRALLALPPGARAVAHVLTAGAEESRDRVLIAIGAKPSVEMDDRLGPVPTLEPADAIRDGAWPPQAFAVGDLYTMRDRRLVPVEIYPFRYDDATARLTLTHSLTVRVDFVGGASRGALSLARPEASTDRHHDGVFATQVLNWEQGRAWRGARPAMADEGLGMLRGRAGYSSLLPRSGQATAAFDENAPEVRVRIDTTGVYALPYDTLAAYGFPTGVPVAEVAVHRHEFVQDVTVPYVTYDLPLEVDDANSNGVFDAGDQVVVWVWDWAARSHASVPQRDWSDAEVVYVTRKLGGSGQAIAHRSGWLNRTDLVPLASYPAKQRFRIARSYLNFPPDTLTDLFLWTSLSIYSAPDDLPLAVNDIDASRPETLTVNWQSGNTSQHITWAKLVNGLNQGAMVVDSAVWIGLRSFSKTGVLAPGAITEGRNTLRVWGKTDDTPSGNSITFAGVHSFDLTYWRAYSPLAGYLACNSGTEVAAFEIRAGPFSTPAGLRAYDVTDSLNPVRLDNVVVETAGTDYYLHLQDTAAPGVQRRYVVCETPRHAAPGGYGRVTRYRAFDHTAGDYLLIVPEGYLATVQPLVDLHTRQGLRVVVAPLEGVNDEFNGGRRSSYAIKRFIRYAYLRWDAQFVLLVGDGSEDPMHYISTSSPDVVPAQKILGPVPTFTGSGDYLKEIIPSDAWYGFCLTCTDPSIQAPLLDISVGRLPASSVSMLDGMVQKIVKYDDLTGDQSWRRNLLIMADDEYSGVSTFDGSGSGYCRHFGETRFRQIDVVVDSLARKSAGIPSVNSELFNLSYYLPNHLGDYTVSGDTCRNSQLTFQSRARLTATPALFTRLNAGQFWWSYQGHANEFVMSHESFYVNQEPTDDKVNFQNDGHPFFFTGFSCHPNAFAHVNGADPRLGPAFGEEFVTLPRGGAIASYSSAGFEAVPLDFTRHLHIYLAKAMLVNPPRDEVLGDRGSRGILGEVIQAGLVANYNGRLSSPSEQYVGLSYCLLGDPATRMSLGPPGALVTANSLPVVSGQDIRLHTVGDTLRIDADLGSNVRLDSLSLERTTPTGTTRIWKSPDPLPSSLSITPAFPDTAALGALYGGRRFHLTWKDNLVPDSYRYTIRTTDRYLQNTSFDAVLSYRTVLQVGGQAIADGDIVSPSAVLTVQLLSPKPLVPLSDLTLTVNNVVQTFVPSPANGDLSGREWILSWTHAPYAPGTIDVKLVASGGATRVNTFRVSSNGDAVELHNAMVFPNPFDDDYLRALQPGGDVATVFSFDLVSATPADVTLRVYTISGRLIYERTERGLDARYHQIPWNGLDAEGYPLANGVYFYRILARNSSATTMQEGRLVKLRRPHQGTTSGY